MKKNYIIVVVLSMLLGFASCDYLDVVPDERPTEEDAFKDKYAAERYLYSCYAFMPQERQIDNIVNHGQTVSSTKMRLPIFCWGISRQLIWVIFNIGLECMAPSGGAIPSWIM